MKTVLHGAPQSFQLLPFCRVVGHVRCALRFIDEILEKRHGAVCAVLSKEASMSELAGLTGLRLESSDLREIDRSTALRYAVVILYLDLTYSTPTMIVDEARRLSTEFIEAFPVDRTRFFTNGSLEFTPDDPHEWGAIDRWNPATGSTFDLGVVAISEQRSGCLWVEDED